MKRVCFMFKMLESILGLCCLGYHIHGFLNVDIEYHRYVYIAVFGGFSSITMFGCLSICIKKENIKPFREGFLNTFGAVAFISVSVNTMYEAKKNFNLISEQEQHAKDDQVAQLHPLFKYSKAQSVAALWCGFLFLLHSILAFDYAFFDDTDMDESDYEDESEHQLYLYVFGKKVHDWLEQFEFFSNLADKPRKFAREELLVRIKMEDT